MATGTGQDRTLAKALARHRSSAARAILFERLWPRLLPLVLIAALYATVAWFGLFRIMPDWARLAHAFLFVLAALGALWLLAGVRRPAAAEIDRRLELTNALQHQPLAAQDEALAQGAGDPFAEALWKAHRARLASQLRGLQTPLPKPDIPRRDPLALRAVVALFAVTAFAWSFGSGGGRLSDVLYSHASFNTPPPRIDAWVTPPAYTRRPPVYLAGGQDTAAAAAPSSMPPETAAIAPNVTVPQGSIVTVRITGGYGEPALAFTGADAAAVPLEADEASPAGQTGYTFTLDSAGALALSLNEDPLANWTFAVIPDAPPVIDFAKPDEEAVKQAGNGALELNYTLSDDYGVTSARGVLSLLEADRGYRPLYEVPELPLALPMRRDETAARTTRNLTDHPFAGRTMMLELEATDAASQTARSAGREITLPARPFSNPLARAIAEQRQILALNADDAAYIFALLEAIMLRPEDFITTPSHMLGLSTIRARLAMAETDDEYRSVADYMWEVALGIENGNLTDAERRLQQAQQALRDALQNGASDEEIARRIEELREAMNDFLREFAENARRNPQAQAQQNQQNQQQMGQRDLDRMLDQMRELSEQGARAQAEQMLSQLENMLNNLQMGQQAQGQQGQGNRMQQQMNELGEILREQQRLMDETQRAERGQQGEGEQGQEGEGQQGQGQQGQGQQGQGQQGQNGQPMPGQRQGQGQGQGFGGLGEEQRALQDRLGRFMDGMQGSGIEPGEEFGRAQGEMGEAGQSLGQGDGQGALGNQADALNALRQGAQDMMQQMQEQAGDQPGQQNGQGQGGGTQAQGGTNGPDDRDPLGRPRASTGPDFGDSVRLPDEIDIQRAREILEEIRRRLGNAISPQLEKDYLERLLDFNR
ncbi:MAG: TIGR02302 family protein [Rhizobiaceae bacterium]|nr:TIGR02302 family protein [Rhizobiaceae bacterium]